MASSIKRTLLLLAFAAVLGTASAIAFDAAGEETPPSGTKVQDGAVKPADARASAPPLPAAGQAEGQGARSSKPAAPEPSGAAASEVGQAGDKPLPAPPAPPAASKSESAVAASPEGRCDRPCDPPVRSPEKKPSLKELLSGFDPLDLERVNGHFVQEMEPHGTAVLSLVPGLQEHVAKILKRYKVPFGAVVALEPSTGRVLAYVSHSSADPQAGDLARDPTPPSASVFKVITAAALLDAGVGPDRRVCYGGGMRKLVEADLVDDPARDRHCLTLRDALGYSANAVFAKLADRHLEPRTLERYASAFGFGHSLPFDARTRPSPMEVPSDRVEFARTAAGFWHMYMSPLHGALIAATIANRGVMPRAYMIDKVVDASGRDLRVRQPTAFRSVIPSSTARVLGRMMTRTVTHGTARRAFFDPQGRAFLPGLQVAGKTGSLTREQPFRAYSWWVGFAPVDRPCIALAALVVNSPRWRIKASYLARETLRYYLIEKKG
jgi:peptidoglycan glycosyltransferase